MEILFVSTELSPYVKVGGLGDVAAALPKALRALGHKVTVLLPRFPAFEAGGLLVARRLTPLKVQLGGRTVDVTVFDGRLASQVDIVLVDAPGLFDRAGIYGERGEDYPDNAERFGVLSAAAALLAAQRAQEGTPFDIVHVNDWPSALAPRLLADLGLPTRTVLTIHNLAHQGVFPKDDLPKTGLQASDFHVGGAEFYGKVSFLKQGIVSADAVTTVSPSYAREIATAEGGMGLDGVLRAKGKLVGVLNGVDYGIWNPATDPALVARYDAEDTANKARCKAAVLRDLGLDAEDPGPLVVCVGRVVEQKGSDLLAEALPRALRGSDARFVVAGDGDPALVAKLEEATSKSHGRALFLRAPDETTVHRLFAGADLALVPSRFEPCGLTQMYAQRYGAVPVARRTGGLADTIVDADAKLETGTGFLFDEPTADALVAAIQRAVAATQSHGFGALRRRVMRLDRSWDRSARQIEALYRGLVRAA